MDIFEAIMMVCFGASWPVSIWKTVKVKNPIGKSVIFLWLVEIGRKIGAALQRILGGVEQHVKSGSRRSAYLTDLGFFKQYNV